MLKRSRSLILPASVFLIGVVLAVSGLLPASELGELVDRTVPVLLFVVAMTLVTELADEAGVFRAVTSWIAQRGLGPDGKGRVLVLWLFVVALSALCTVFLSLDSTAVLVTPVVVLLALSARVPPLPFALTTVWLANTCSLLLPVSNLTNLLAQHQLHASPLAFAALVWAPALVGLLVPAGLILLLFRRDLRGSFRPRPSQPPADRILLLTAGITVVVLLPLLVSGIQVALPAGAAALFLVGVFLVRRRSSLRWGMLPWRPLLLTSGLFLVVQTLQVHGLAVLLAGWSGTGNGFPELLRLAGLGALASNTVNNLPAYLALEPVADSPVRLAALLVGVNLGPVISPWASLATLLWHERLRALGVSISWRGFALAGLILAAVLVPLSVLALWFAAGLPA
ncbi:MAG: arsenic transporter [Micrococcaceae bacterium]|nr:arsenic transporter [Micrococcaceae bacterium]